MLSLSPAGAHSKSLSPSLPDAELTQDFSLPSSLVQHRSGQEDVQCCSQRLLCQALFHAEQLERLHLLSLFFPGLRYGLLPTPGTEQSITLMHECFLPCHLMLFPPLCADKTKKKASSKQKACPGTVCGHYSRSEPAIARVSIIRSSQFSYRFSASSVFSFSNETNLHFSSFLFLSEAGNLWCKRRNPAPDPQSLRRRGSLISVSEGLGAARDTVSLLGLLHKFLRLRGFLLFCLAKHT